MSSHSILIYGAGNCEIAGELEFQLNHITQIDKANIKIFARGYLFNNSCMSMYRRFKVLKDKVKEVNQGGIHEYFYNEEETIKTCELKMGPASDKAFEEFLNEGIRRLQNDEIILVLIGQGNLNGIFLDFLQNPPMYIAYEHVFKIINKCCQKKVKKLHLIIDVPQWHNVYMPLRISQYSCIHTMYIYERHTPLSIFPIMEWALQVFDKDCHWLEATYMQLGGYKIDLHPVWWERCISKWEVYVEFPSARSFEDFFDVYKKIVVYDGVHKSVYSKVLRNKTTAYNNPMSEIDIKEYFNIEYLSDVHGDEVEKWLSELKICTDYYK